MKGTSEKRPVCHACQHFHNDPAYLEAEIPGLFILSSAYASVRSNDGVCSFHDRLQNARSWCVFFEMPGMSHHELEPELLRKLGHTLTLGAP